MSSAARKITDITFSQIEAALDAGKLEMIRPQGDWVPVRRRTPTITFGKGGHGKRMDVWMERNVEACISSYGAMFGFSDVRIV